MTTIDKMGNIVSHNPPTRFKWDRFKTANLIIKEKFWKKWVALMKGIICIEKIRI